MTSLLFDSVIVIDHFNGVEAATRYLRDHREEIAISVITRAEVLTGFDGEQEVLAKAVLAALRHFPVTGEDADLAARLRQQNRWKPLEASQAAITPTAIRSWRPATERISTRRDIRSRRSPTRSAPTRLERPVARARHRR